MVWVWEVHFQAQVVGVGRRRGLRCTDEASTGCWGWGLRARVARDGLE